MEKSIKKKLKKVLLAFLALSIPIAYLTYTSILIDNVNNGYEKAIMWGEAERIDITLKKIEKAEKLVLFNKSLLIKKAQLLYQKKEYRQALKAIEKKERYIYKALLYEHLSKSDSAAIFYQKAIPKLKKQLDKEKDINLAYQIERQIALFYTFLEQTDKAKEYLPQIPEDYNPDLKELLLHYDFYIENYISGGYKDFMEGESIRFTADSISDNIDVDSLIKANRFYANSSSRMSTKREYEIKKIFESKAINIGLYKIKE